MYAAFISRVREFGALQAIGFTRRAIRGVRELTYSPIVGEVMVNARGALVVRATGIYLHDTGSEH